MHDLKWYRSIGFKSVLFVAIAATLVNGIFGYMIIHIHQEHLDETILRSAIQLSDTIEKSIKSDMLENRKENAYRIMDTIAAQEGIERVRIYSSDGKIIFSSDKGEFGTLVDQKAEACYGCHSEKKPLEKLNRSDRNRIYSSSNGYRVLGMINPLNNERECSSSTCHFHPESQKVLGVIDITMSLLEIDREVASTRNRIVFFNILSIVAISWIIAFIFMRLIGKPVSQLIQGPRRVATGDLGYTIPIDSDDEMGFLAASFNGMTLKLKEANQEIQKLIKDLEHKVDERTKELRETQFQLIQSEKLAAVGKIAAGVAHEINNPLSGVFTYIKLMERKIEQGDSSPEDIEQFKKYLLSMGKEIERTRVIVRDLLDFTRQKEPVRKSMDLNQVVLESIHLISNEMNIHGIELVKNLSHLPDISVDPAQVQQVFIGIMVNAIQAMEGGGTLTVNSSLNEKDRIVAVEFIDTGVGIDPEDLTKIFDPFFTTRTKGTGLGLSVVYGIVSKHGGKVEVESEVGKGTIMRVLLPLDSGGREQFQE